MTIQEAHYQFKLSMDRLDTLSNEDFNKAEIDWLLNEAQMIFIKKRFEPEGNYKHKGFEASQKRLDDLSSLVINYPNQPSITPTMLDSGIYEVSLNTLSFPYLFLVSAYINVDIGNNCTKDVLLKFVQHDDYRTMLRDPFNTPSFEYIPYNIAKSSAGAYSSLFIYTGDLPSSYIYKVFVEYIKKPNKVSYGNYTYIDGITYPPTTFELPEHTHFEIIDLACQIGSLAIENPEYIQLKNQKAFLSE